MKNLLLLTMNSILAVGLAGACSGEPDRPTSPTGEKRADRGAAPDPAGPGEAATPAEEKMVFEGPGKRLPREAGAWRLASAPRYFGPDNLYDLINGGAEIYVQLGLEKMVTADYRSPKLDGVTVTAEIYDMGSPRGAFGRTARFLESLVDPSDAGEGLPEAWADRGILGDGDLKLWKDRYLVHLTWLDESADATPESIGAASRAHLPKIAEAIRAKIEDDAPAPPAVERFPEDGRIARSEAWTPDDVLGIEGLGPGFTARYEVGEARLTAFATEELADEQAAAAAWKAVKSDEARDRRIAVQVAGKRVVGLVASGDAASGEARIAGEALEARAAALVDAFEEE